MPRPQEGAYTTNGWGTVTLRAVDDGFNGTYTNTRNADLGAVALWIENGQWIGSWDEPGIDRGGELYSITISENGSSIKGLVKVTRLGGHRSFEDVPFEWKRN